MMVFRGGYQTPHNKTCSKNHACKFERAEEMSGVPPSHTMGALQPLAAATTQIHKNNSKDTTQQCRHDIALKGVTIRLVPGSWPTT
mmetsp:Transcript_16450/g.28186  ORF Transcript_16450/g.28186 Transcript_16450/m.28186 type:complete len:86 (+) Transcript_16450:124-381(+)